jgi:hypothetical protein
MTDAGWIASGGLLTSRVRQPNGRTMRESLDPIGRSRVASVLETES